MSMLLDNTIPTTDLVFCAQDQLGISRAKTKSITRNPDMAVAVAQAGNGMEAAWSKEAQFLVHHGVYGSERECVLRAAGLVTVGDGIQVHHRTWFMLRDVRR